MCNVKKFKLKNRPTIKLGKDILEYVQSVKYLGVIINEMFNDNDDVKRQMRCLYARSNMLLSNFYSCTNEVKSRLFNAFCSNMYCVQLWWNVSQSVIRKVEVAYNSGYKHLLGLNKFASTSNTLTVDGVFSFQELYRKSLYSFHMRLMRSENSIINAIVTSSKFDASAYMLMYNSKMFI